MTRIAREKPRGRYKVGVVKEPRLPAYLDNEGIQLRVWCCWCDARHHHGAGCKESDEYPLYGGRAAHCFTDSPYTHSGYVLTDPAELDGKP